MPRYLFAGQYSPQGSKGVLAGGGTARRAAIEKMVSDVGGRVETFDFAFGSDDIYTIVDLPDALEPLVEYYRSISGEHPDWDDYRAAMVRQAKCLVRLTVERWGPVATGGFPPSVAPA